MSLRVSTEGDSDVQLRLLSAGALLKKVRDGITVEALYRDAERKFDTLVMILSDAYRDNSLLESVDFTIENLKQVAREVFERLISNRDADPFMTLCVRETESLDEIRRRRNKLLLIFHPDRNGDALANESKTRKINEAYGKIVTNHHEAAQQFKNTRRGGLLYSSCKERFYILRSTKRRRIMKVVLILISILLFIGFVKVLFIM